jgi:transitional endoplasmic reticulum ATPase
MADSEAASENTVRLQVAAARQEESGRGVARLPRSAMQSLGVTEGDIVQLSGKRSTAAIVMAAYDEDQALSVVRLDGLQRANAEVGSGEHVKIEAAQSRPATRVVFAPASREMRLQGPTQALKRNFFRKPIVSGDLVATTGQQPVQNMPPEVQRMFNAPAYALTQIRLRVISTAPKGIVHIDENTEIELRPDFEEPKAGRSVVNYDDVGGISETIQQLREMVELPLRYPELFTRLGVDPPKGVLLHGPPGTGKTRLAQAVANESDAEFFAINGPEIMGSGYGESEKRLREVFDNANQNAPAIIFIDEIDSIAPKRDSVPGEAEKRLVAQLLTLMDGLESRANIVVIAATNRPDAIDEALRRPGRFDREIVIGVPDENGRREILAIHTRGMPLGEGVDLKELAKVTHGFVGADIAALAREAAIDAVRRIMPQIDLDAQTIPTEVLENLHVGRDDFLSALKRIQPSAMREVMVQVPDVGWSDLGGIDDAIEKLKEGIELPIKNRDAFHRLGIRAAKGFLLYGRPAVQVVRRERAADRQDVSPCARRLTLRYLHRRDRFAGSRAWLRHHGAAGDGPGGQYRPRRDGRAGGAPVGRGDRRHEPPDAGRSRAAAARPVRRTGLCRHTRRQGARADPGHPYRQHATGRRCQPVQARIRDRAVYRCRS